MAKGFHMACKSGLLLVCSCFGPGLCGRIGCHLWYSIEVGISRILIISSPHGLVNFNDDMAG
jgi:hypothetical protein